MLLINSKDQIEYDIDYLKNEELKTLDDVIHRYESSNMNLFYHVVNSPTCRYEKKVWEKPAFCGNFKDVCGRTVC